MSDLATKSAIMEMVGQILPGLVREKMFDFSACAIEIENEFGISMTVDEIRLAFAKYELQRTTASDSNDFDDNNEDEEESESEESQEEEYNSYPDRFGNRQRRQQQQQQQQRTTANVDDDIPAPVSSWLSFDNNQTERKEEKDTEEDIASVSMTNNNPLAPSTSTNIYVPSNTNTNNNNNNNNENNSNGDGDDDISPYLTLSLPNASVMESLIAELAAEKELPNNDSDNSNSNNSINSNEPKSEMQQVLDILAQPDDPRMHRKVTMQELFGMSEEEFNRQLSEVEREHEEQIKREKIAEENEKQRIADEKKKLSGQTTTEDSIRKAVNDAKIKEVFDRVVKVLGIEDEDDGQAVIAET